MTDPASDQKRPSTAPPPSCDDEMYAITERSDAHGWSSQSASVHWPKNQVPVEIFEIIISHLTRLEVRCLRLVCKEFEIKVSAQYFRNVVVPFKSELYSKLDRDENGALKRTSSALLSNGMRIFQSFGRHIRRFALSLELDEDTLSYPPIKPSQEAVPSFWGIYRWPHGTYHRYTDLEGLEQTADETEAMKEALKCLVNVTNLGICCDAGLGFLLGPDHIARSAATLHPVFATQNWRVASSEPHRRKQAIVSLSDSHEMVKDTKKPVFENPISFKWTVLQKMASDAGYVGDQIDDAVRMILDTEGTDLTTIDFDERASLINDMESRPPLSLNNIRADFEPVVADVAGYALIPSSLTRAQKEMLLELEWAHRAMIQSYVIGLIDNARDCSFTNLTTLTIAKIPSSHVYIFYRHDLWQSLPSLNNVSLGVIADWRRISKSAPGCVEDDSVSPVDAVGKVYQLLNSYIGAQANIESLHFEWICGGEFAPSTFQRNHYILPAPFFEDPQLMTRVDSPRTHKKDILILPFIKHLSLKNCWASPHVFLQTIRNMALCELEKLELESVSLSGPPTLTPQAPLQGHITNLNTAHLFGLIAFPPGTQPQPHPAHGAAGPPPAPPPPLPIPPMFQHALQPNTQPNAAPGPLAAPPDVLQQPEMFSWAGIIEHFSPSIKIQNILAARDEASNSTDQLVHNQPDPLGQHIPSSHRLGSDEKKYTLKCLSFKSCGYVSIDVAAINTRSILPFGTQALAGNGNPHSSNLGPLMQKSRDKLLGRIAPFLQRQELFQLTTAFGLDIGWENIYDQRTIFDAMSDGVESPGRGRFSGTIDAITAEARGDGVETDTVF
ncbi:f-box containing [Fusarium longipes]|uniref:F-box containing n=1 Tax=Fusarium longipes TaxID=694270 RepID=A0A395T837_9HYPO|nr:f-box containing [Fusarium longipes]